MPRESPLADPAVQDRILELLARGLTFEQASGAFKTHRKAIQRQIQRDALFAERVRVAQETGVVVKRLTAGQVAAPMTLEERKAMDERQEVVVAKIKADLNPPPLAEKWWKGERPTPDELLAFMSRVAATPGHPLQGEAMKALSRALAVELRGESAPVSSATRTAREKAEQEAADAEEKPHVPRGLTVLALPESADVELDEGGEAGLEQEPDVADVG